jgi:transcriptional regulator of arginine metabolism
VYIYAIASRVYRQQKIARLIAARRVANQHELRALLEADGIVASQATLSRDLHELGVAKGVRGYTLAAGDESPVGNGHADPMRTLARSLERELLSADHGGSMVVLRTRPGHANALAVEIDGSGLPSIVGTIAGDDTIFVAARSASQVRSLVERFRTLAGHA